MKMAAYIGVAVRWGDRSKRVNIAYESMEE